MQEELKTRTLARRFLEGATTLDEELTQARLLRHPDLPADLEPLARMIADLQAVALPREEAVEDTAAITPPRRRKTLWPAAAAVAALLSVGIAAHFSGSSNDECVAYVYGQRTTDRHVVLEEMRQGLNIACESDIDRPEEVLKELFQTE